MGEGSRGLLREGEAAQLLECPGSHGEKELQEARGKRSARSRAAEPRRR